MTPREEGLDARLARIEEKMKSLVTETHGLRDEFRRFRDICVTQRELSHMRWAVAIGIAIGLGNSLAQIAEVLK